MTDAIAFLTGLAPLVGFVFAAVTLRSIYRAFCGVRQMAAEVK